MSLSGAKAATNGDGEPAAALAGVQLADRIAEDVRRSNPAPGSVIASEPELRALHDAGRSVFRQAVRILEERGVAYMRRGHGGGLVVAEPNAAFAGRALSIVIESLTQEIAHLAVLPTAVDTHLILYAAPRLSAETCARLRQLARRLDRLSGEDFIRLGAHRQLNAAIRTASGEPAAVLAHQAALEYSIDMIPYSVNAMAERVKGEVWDINLQTVEALIAGDAETMFNCRRRQIELFRESFPSWPEIERDPSQAPRIDDASRPEFQVTSNQAERLAREILREIRLLGWEPGARIGGGAELMERYGAGTNILRQAVRMLQEHSAVHVERGRKGGLFVAAPDPARAVQRAVGYLQHGAAAPGDVRAFLAYLATETLETLQGPPPPSNGAPPPRTAPGGTLGRLGEAAARLSGNPAVALFIEILLAVLPDGPVAREDVLAFERATASGDLAQARRLILRAATSARPSETA